MKKIAAAMMMGLCFLGCEEREPAGAGPRDPSAAAPPAAEKPGGATPKAPTAEPPAAPAAAPETPPEAPSARGVITAAGVTMPIPEGWEEVQPGNPMRIAELRVPGEPEPAVVAFSIAGGDVEANMQRWAGQFTGGGQPSFGQREISGITVHTAEIDGNFSNMGAATQENYALRGAVVPIAGGQSLFIKMTGPKPLIERNTDAFYGMLAGLQAGGVQMPGGLQVPGR